MPPQGKADYARAPLVFDADYGAANHDTLTHPIPSATHAKMFLESNGPTLRDMGEPPDAMNTLR